MTRFWLRSVLAASGLLALPLCRVSRAVAISLDTTNSYVSASTSNTGVYMQQNVTSFPASNVTATATDNSLTDTSMTGSYSPGGFTFMAAATDPNGEGTDDYSDTFFTANQDIAFSASGSWTVNGSVFLASTSASLFDSTTSTFVYQDNDDAFDQDQYNLPLPSETGQLMAGHSYELITDFYQSNGDPTGNGSYNFNLGASVPAPTSFWIGSAAIILVAGWTTFRHTQACPS
jgi:hypothetical protein